MTSENNQKKINFGGVYLGFYINFVFNHSFFSTTYSEIKRHSVKVFLE